MERTNNIENDKNFKGINNNRLLAITVKKPKKKTESYNKENIERVDRIEKKKNVSKSSNLTF